MELNDMDIGITPLLYRVAHKCNLIHNEKLKEFSVSIQQVAVLGVIEFIGDGAINQKTLSDEMGIKESSISSLIKTMIKNNLIYKEQSKSDGRNMLLKATQRGKDICSHLKANVGKVEDELYGSLTDEERKSFIAILKKLA